MAHLLSQCHSISGKGILKSRDNTGLVAEQLQDLVNNHALVNFALVTTALTQYTLYQPLTHDDISQYLINKIMR